MKQLYGNSSWKAFGICLLATLAASAPITPTHADATFNKTVVVPASQENYNNRKAKAFIQTGANGSYYDIVVNNSNNSNGIAAGFWLYEWNQSSGTWNAPTLMSTAATGSEETGVADINNDGYQDLVVGGLDENLFWLQNPGSAGGQ